MAKVVAADFAGRLTDALCNNPLVPPKHHGQHLWLVEALAKQYNVVVSRETVRKWIEGLTRPTPDKMQKIAALLSVEPAWLAFGKMQELEFREQQRRNISLPAAAHLLAGYVLLDENQIADSNQSHIDFHAIVRGVHHAFHASLALPLSGNQFKFVITTEWRECTVVGVIRGIGTSVSFVEFTHLVLEKAQHLGGFVEVIVTQVAKDFYFDNQKLRQFYSFSQKL